MADVTELPSNHPRYNSLKLRERLLHGFKSGLATEAGLLAHGRGEAFHYLLGERTHDFAKDAMAVASAILLTAVRPVISVNGNAAALASSEIIELTRTHGRLTIEVNLFYHSDARSKLIATHLRNLGASQVVESSQHDSVSLPNIQSSRRRMNAEGIGKADVVLVALEDGDRCGALVDAGKKVIAVDLNPLSRTAQMAHVTIVDELTSAIKLLTKQIESDRSVSREELVLRGTRYDNTTTLDLATAAIRSGVR